MVDSEIQEEFESILNRFTNSSTGITTFTLKDGVELVDHLGIYGNTTGKPSVPYEEIPVTLTFNDNLLLKLNGTSLVDASESIKLSEDLTVLLNNITVYSTGITNHTLSFIENFTIQDTIRTYLPINSTTFSEGIQFNDDILLKINGTFLLNLPEYLLLSEQDTIFLNNETVLFDIQNTSSNLIHSEIEIGKPVFWTQTVMVNDTKDLQNILVELPADAQNITVAKIENGRAIEIPANHTEIIEPELEETENEYDVPKRKEMSLDEIAQKHKIRKIISLDYAELENLKEVKQKDKPTKALLINRTATQINNVTLIDSAHNQTENEYQIQFETPAPYALEYDNSTPDKFQKNVTVAHDSTLHYTDVRSYSNIPENLAIHNTQFKLHWMINDTKVDVTNDPRFDVTFVDTDGNHVFDRMEWYVPQLSQQEFEIEADIYIINVQSYPIVGGNWTVQFTTNGTADLVIKGIDATTFGNSLPDDLTFLELNNGTHTLTPIVNLTANTIIYHNYTSNYTGFETSKVLTPGKHHLEFRFGTDVAYAHNLAVAEIPHAFAFNSAGPTKSGTTYSDIPGSIISSSNFIAGNKYLLFFTAVANGDRANAGDGLYLRAVHGATAFDESENIMVMDDTSGTGDFNQYIWFTVWTATSAQDIKLQFKTANTGVIMTVDEITLFALEISEKFVEGQDWFYDEVTKTSAVPTSWSTTNNAEITIPDSVPANNEWLVMGTSQMGDFSDHEMWMSRIQSVGDINEGTYIWSQEEEDGAGSIEKMVQTLLKVYTLPATNPNTFTSENQKDGGGTDPDARKHSAIFAINLDKFDSHSAQFTAGKFYSRIRYR